MYENGANVIVSNCYGKGRAILAGTEIFRQYMREPQTPASDFFKREILKIVTPDAVCAGNASNVEVLRLKGSAGIVNVIINHNKEPRVFTVELPDGNTHWIYLLTGEQVNLSKPLYLSSEDTIVIYKKRMDK